MRTFVAGVKPQSAIEAMNGVLIRVAKSILREDWTAASSSPEKVGQYGGHIAPPGPAASFW